MTADQATILRMQLEALGLSQSEAASELGIGVRTMARYCSGEGDVPQSVVMALHLLELARKSEVQQKWIADFRVRMGYVRADGSTLDVTEQEVARLVERSASYKKRARSVVRRKR